jgi:membrane protease YdiL (CAAX protease family)
LTDAAPGAPPPDSGAEPRVPPAGSQRAPGLFRFGLEGRRAPALFVGGWLSAIIGGGLTAIAFLSATSLATAILFLAGLLLLSVGLVLLGGSQAIERKAAGEPYAGPSPVLLFLAIVAVTLLVAAVVGTVLDLLGVTLDKPLGDLFSVVLQAAVFVGVVRLMVVDAGAISWRDMGLPRRLPAATAALATGAVLAIPVIVVTALVAGVLVQLVGQVPPSPLPPTGTASGFGLHLLAGGAVAPFSEEIVFRGAALTAWLRSTGPKSAILRSAILFAAAHALGIGGSSFGQAFGLALVATVARLPVAMALGWIYVRTGTIWASIGLHATFNVILIAISELGPAVPTALLLG